MRIHCDSCSQALDLPDDKIPPKRFSVACPTCQNKIVVDPPSAGGVETNTPVEATPDAAPQSPDPNLGGGVSPAENTSPAELAPLRGLDRELLESIPPTAIIVHQDVPADPRLEVELKKLGIREIHRPASLEEACEIVLENEISILLVRMAKIPAPPCPPLEPVYKLPFELRRKTFVAVLAENVKTLDGQVAFYLQVNCLIQAAEPALAAKLRRALLHHLRLYRHWHRED